MLNHGHEAGEHVLVTLRFYVKKRCCTLVRNNLLCTSDPALDNVRRYVEPEGGRFIPALKPACARDKGPDPYGTYKHMTWTKANTGFTGGMGSVSKMAPTWSTFSLSRPAVGQ